MVTEQWFNKSEVARKVGVDSTSIGNWVKAYQADGSVAFPGNGRLKPQDEEIRRLKEENRQLKMERDFLKKTAVFFAKEQK